MRNRFFGLRHHTIVSRNHQNNDVGCFCTACAHRRKRFMARRIEEGNHAARRLDMVRTNMLRDATGFTCSYFGATDVIKQRSFAVIDVAHYGNHWRTRQ